MRPESGLHSISAADVGAVLRELEGLSWHVYVLPEGITDKRSFFEAVRSTMPLDPTVHGEEKWDAISDSLWSGLDALDAHKIAIIWPDSGTMAEQAPDDFNIARAILADITDSLADTEATVGRPKEVMAVLA
jgi:hypothetical protein